MFTTMNGNKKYFLDPPLKAGDRVWYISPGHVDDGKIFTISAMGRGTMKGFCTLDNGAYPKGASCARLEYAERPYPEIKDNGVYDGPF